jgi:c-di-GMP-binding flagellar brake protein YcgR
MADPPAINSLLYVVFDDDIGFPTRVEDLDGPVMTIAAPIGRGDLEIPAPGSELQVVWTASRTRYMWPVEMLSRTKGRLNRWNLRGIGQPMRHNRRRYVRGEASGPVTVITTGRKAQAKEFNGYLVDVCEGGARCRMRRSR